LFNAEGQPNQIWIDGIKQAESLSPGNIQTDPENRLIFFGRSDSIQKETSYFIGRLDEVNIFNCALDSLHIQYLYQTGSVFNYRYIWDTGDTASVIAVSPKVMTTYYATVTDGVNACTDSVKVDVNPEIELTLEQLDIGCPGEDKAKMLAHVEGGTSAYLIEWDEKIKYLQGDTLALGLTDSLDYTISVTDARNCRIDETFQVDAKPAPSVSFEFLPEEVYYQNPVVSFTSSTENAANWSWNFGDGNLSSLENPEHVFEKVETYHVVLTVTAENGCIDSTSQDIDIQEVELTIPNVFTPNGDGINDTFVIKELDKYISNRLVVFNRWGSSVFEQNDYISGDWDGGNLADGTYYYVLKCKGYFSDDEFRGTVNILTGGLK
jgi:gliding motility-associated-like protein